MRCGAELGVGRFCLNCGHPIGEPAPAQPAPVETYTPEAPTSPSADPQTPVEPVGLPLQAADPTPAPPGAPARPESQWDPREDLLPYEEVDDPESDAPLTGRAWIAWVVGAVLLVGLVLGLLEVFGTDGDDSAARDPASSESSAPAPGPGSQTPDEGSEGSEATDAPAGVGRRIEMAGSGSVAVPETAPPTTDFDGNLVAYEASQMNDGNLSTTWRMAGDATGQTLTLTLAEPAVVYRIGLVNGYTKQVAGVDWYPNNRRILAVTWSFEDGTTLEQTFAERPGLQMLTVPPVQTSTVGITITAVTPPGTGSLGRDYTAISEVSVIGRRAG